MRGVASPEYLELQDFQAEETCPVPAQCSESNHGLIQIVQQITSVEKFEVQRTVPKPEERALPSRSGDELAKALLASCSFATYMRHYEHWPPRECSVQTQ
jgi:hypothetical protein